MRQPVDLVCAPGDVKVSATMWARLGHIAEAMALRFLPGIINLFVLISLAAWMSTKTYGIVSTYIATSGALANFLFGHIILSALALHSEYVARGEQKAFEQFLVTISTAFAMLVGSLALILWLAGIPFWTVLIATGAFAAYTAIQEILHARVQFIRFAIASTVQSASFLALAFLWVRPSPGMETALLAFAASYAIGAVASALLSRTAPMRLSGPYLKDSLRVGTPITLSNGAADAFALGCRYLLVLFGAFQVLGVFSFSLDLAQKTVGVFINAATFATVARAFKGSASVKLRALRGQLWRGATIAAGIALMSLCALIVLGTLGIVQALDRPVYDPISLIIVSVAVIANRTGKMVITPLALRLKQTGIVLTAFAIAAPIAFIVAAGGILLGLAYAVEIGYVIAFVLWVAIAEMVTLRRIRGIE